MKTFLLCIVIFLNYAFAKAQLETTTLQSDSLQREITVSTYTTGDSESSIPIIYFTDGKKMIDSGTISRLQELTDKNEIPKAMYVFVHTIDDTTGNDHRNEYFFCNENYLTFFEKELIPKMESQFPSKIYPKDRTLIGISFGGLNSAYFSAVSQSFKNFGLLSPVTYPRQDLLMKQIAFSKNEALYIFLSTGVNDAERYIQPLKNIYTSKGYHIRTHVTKGGHDFKNWNSQLKEALSHLVAHSK